jgi:hypothetical protein
MKRLILLTAIFSLGLFGPASAQQAAERFLGLPVIDGKVIDKTDARLEILSPKKHDHVLAFYMKKLEGMEDIRVRDWPDQSYIEDDSNRDWHSITIDKEFKDGTKIVIMKDNWTWIIGTLILRYVGVFAVLLILLLGMTLSGKIISSRVEKSESK